MTLGAEVLVGKVPVDEAPPGVKIVDPGVSVVDVIGVLPHVAGDDGLQASGQRVACGKKKDEEEAKHFNIENINKSIKKQWNSAWRSYTGIVAVNDLELAVGGIKNEPSPARAKVATGNPVEVLK